MHFLSFFFSPHVVSCVHSPVVFHILVQQPNLGGERFFSPFFPERSLSLFYVGTECCHSISASVEFPLFFRYIVLYIYVIYCWILQLVSHVFFLFVCFYLPVRNPTISCGSDGRWQGDMPICGKKVDTFFFFLFVISATDSPQFGFRTICPLLCADANALDVFRTDFRAD